MTEYKLSYTAQEIDEKLGKIGEPIDPKSIKDMYYDERTLVDVLLETELTYTPDNGEFEITAPFILTENEEYAVIWNGEEYVSTAHDVGNGGIAVGNIANMMGSGDTGEPFVLVYDAMGVLNEGTYGVAYSMRGETNAVVSIKQINGEINRIPTKYIQPLIVYQDFAEAFELAYAYADPEFTTKVDKDTLAEAYMNGSLVVFQSKGLYRFKPIMMTYPGNYAKIWYSSADDKQYTLYSKEFVKIEK
jgi:hypothetical protein